MSTYSKEHLEAALTWVEHHVHDGIRIVAGALSATYPEDSETGAVPTKEAKVTIDDIAIIKAEEINRQFPGAEAVVLVIAHGEDLIRAGASLPDSSNERLIEIVSQTLELLKKSGK